MSRYDWLNTFEQHLKTGTKEEIEQDIEYCKIRSKLINTKKRNEWDNRKEKALLVINERFDKGN